MTPFSWLGLDWKGLFVVGLVAAGFTAGLWIGDDGEAAAPTVEYKPYTFKESDLNANPLGSLVLWKTPDSSVTRTVEITIPDWFAELPDTVCRDYGVGLDRNLPPYVVAPLQGGDAPIRFDDGRAILQAAHPSSGRMLELGVDLPEDTWRGKVSSQIIAGPNIGVLDAKFDVTKKVGRNLFTLGAGGTAAIVRKEVKVSPTFKAAYALKLF